MPEVMEEVIALGCQGQEMFGVLSRPPAGAPALPVAVVIAVGGPQYRVGSHRQFVLLARRLARSGYPALRFDYRGMGDSDGDMRSFETVGPDMDAAIDALAKACPQAREIVVWGLCDAASAALMFAAAHPKVGGIVAANPWARSEATLAATHVKHYYSARLMQREFWAKLLRGGLDWRASLAALLGNLRAAGRAAPSTGQEAFQVRMARGLAAFRGRTLLILSGNDLTAKEFLHYAASSPAWRGLLAGERVARVDLPEADHTFSSRPWLDEAESATLDWLQDLVGAPGAMSKNGGV